MATSLNTKIVLKNTTKMSLNERFTAYRAQAQNSTTAYRQKIQLQRQANSANLRLAQQMANRPSVRAALRLKKKSLAQRLGRKPTNGNIKARLNLGGNQSSKNPLQGRLGGLKRRGSNRRGGFKPGTSPLLKARLGMPKTGFNNYPSPNKRGGFRNRRGGFRGNNRSGGRSQQRNNNNSQRNARNRGRGGRFNNTNTRNIPTKQELDNQLDEYMAETKTSLDAQLGQYMSHA